MKLRDKFWLWAHPEGYFNNNENDYGFHDVSRMTPTECCLYLGISNLFMVPLRRPINRRQYNKSFKPMLGVAWECFGADKHPERVDRIIEESFQFKNINGAVFDDFFVQVKKRRKKGEDVPVDALKNIRHRLATEGARPLEMWMVLYTREFGLDPAEDESAKDMLDAFGGLIMWTWEEKDVGLIPEKFEILKKLSPNTRKMFGCYLYNFGESKQATAEAVKWQLDFYLEKIRSGEAEGVVLHTNTMADMDFEAYDAAIEWLEEHGDEEI